jgi:hypothetical protein
MSDEINACMEQLSPVLILNLQHNGFTVSTKPQFAIYHVAEQFHTDLHEIG